MYHHRVGDKNKKNKKKNEILKTYIRTSQLYWNIIIVTQYYVKKSLYTRVIFHLTPTVLN